MKAKAVVSLALLAVPSALALSVPASPHLATASTAAVAATMPAARTGTVDVGSTGVDGAFNPTGASYVVDLATQGFYDAQRWMVIFHYTSVNIPAGTTVTFLNHPSRAPVVWLVQSDVTIAGAVRLDGQAGRAFNVSATYAEPGPGGFRGGRGTPQPAGLADDSSAGFGPGGGYRPLGTNTGGGGASFGTSGGLGGSSTGPNGLPGPVYGDTTIAQLIGGSGGSAGRYVAAGSYSAGGGAGGGAIFIAANGTIEILATGIVSANGGAGGYSPQASDGGAGSGGAIRLLADNVFLQRGAPGSVVSAVPGTTVESGGNGGFGRIRIEKNNPGGLSIATNPPAVVIEGGVTGANLLPALSSIPSLGIVSVAGIAAPLDPRSPLGSGASFPDVNLALGGAQTVELEGRNIPLAATIYLRATNANGQATELAVNTTPIGNDTYWTRLVDVTFPSGYTALQARAVLP